MHKLLQYQ